MILIIDNYDSFTFNLVDYFQQLGCETRLIKNDISPKDLDLKGIQGVVISPGPETPDKANRLTELMPLFLGKIPTLGICLGHQAIGLHFGAKLVKAEKPMHGKVSEIALISDFIFEGFPSSIKVVRYHSLLLEQLPDIMTPLAYSNQDELMAFYSKSHSVCGIQFHPEAALTEYGLKMLRNWLSFYHIV